MRDGNACVDAFLSGSDHLRERWPDLVMVNPGTAGMRPKLWLLQHPANGSGVIFSKFFTDTFIVRNAQKQKLAVHTAANVKADLASQIKQLQTRLSSLEKGAGQGTKSDQKGTAAASGAGGEDEPIPLVWSGPPVKGVAHNFRLIRAYNRTHVTDPKKLMWLIDSS